MILPCGRVSHFGMELDGEEPTLLVGHGRDGAVVGRAELHEAARRLHDSVPVAHPDRDLVVALGLDAVEQPAGPLEREQGSSVFTALGGDNVTAEQIAHGLHAVADAEQGQPGLEELPVGQRRVFLVHAGGPA